MPHDAAERVCPATGLRIPEPPRARMAEMPPPERRPEPLSFEPMAGGRAPAPKVKSDPSIPTRATETRNMKHELIGQTIGGRYRVLGILGEGGMGTVYDAEHVGLGRNVAIKVLSPSQAKKRVAVKRFQQEARAAGAIGHPNICEVYDLGLIDDGSPYLVMEKLVGQTLADRISREGGLPFDELSDVIIQVLSGLIAAHEKGIVHRDIKPENVFLARRTGSPPIAKILDFGVSKMIAQFQGGEDQLDLTRTGMVMGTPYYMSPEQARGERNLDGRVDVYACGVMMYEAIAGKRPFLAPNYNALLLAIINTTPKSLKEVRPATPAALEVVVGRAMSKAREQRYPSAMHLLRDLQALNLAKSGPGPVMRVPPPPSPVERMRAPVLGGRDAPSATLKSRMAGSGSTRLDIKQPNKDPESIDIPIHIGSVEHAVTPGDEFDEGPTAVFRPELHGIPKKPGGMLPRRVPDIVQPTPSTVVDSAGKQPAPVDEWDAQTVVHGAQQKFSPHPQSLPNAPKKVSPEETVKLDDANLENIDFDETRIAPQPRRPR
jgi:serine/threonine-protein kinase